MLRALCSVHARARFVTVSSRRTEITDKPKKTKKPDRTDRVVMERLWFHAGVRAHTGLLFFKSKSVYDRTSRSICAGWPILSPLFVLMGFDQNGQEKRDFFSIDCVKIVSDPRGGP
jgi:hypothetical protein